MLALCLSLLVVPQLPQSVILTVTGDYGNHLWRVLGRESPPGSLMTEWEYQPEEIS